MRKKKSSIAIRLHSKPSKLMLSWTLFLDNYSIFHRFIENTVFFYIFLQFFLFIVWIFIRRNKIHQTTIKTRSAKGKSLRYSTWIGRGFFKMLQISLFGVSINIIGHVFFVFAQKYFYILRHFLKVIKWSFSLYIIFLFFVILSS
jgi:hypothetical protein